MATHRRGSRRSQWPVRDLLGQPRERSGGLRDPRLYAAVGGLLACGAAATVALTVSDNVMPAGHGDPSAGVALPAPDSAAAPEAPAAPAAPAAPGPASAGAAAGGRHRAPEDVAHGGRASPGAGPVAHAGGRVAAPHHRAEGSFDSSGTAAHPAAARDRADDARDRADDRDDDGRDDARDDHAHARTDHADRADAAPRHRGHHRSGHHHDRSHYHGHHGRSHDHHRDHARPPCPCTCRDGDDRAGSATARPALAALDSGSGHRRAVPQPRIDPAALLAAVDDAQGA